MLLILTIPKRIAGSSLWMQPTKQVHHDKAQREHKMSLVWPQPWPSWFFKQQDFHPAAQHQKDCSVSLTVMAPAAGWSQKKKRKIMQERIRIFLWVRLRVNAWICHRSWRSHYVLRPLCWQTQLLSRDSSFHALQQMSCPHLYFKGSASAVLSCI